MQSSKPLVIIDTDPGVDDALAILFAKKTGIEIRALTTVHGNSNIENVTKNACYLSEYLGNIPVYKGSAYSLDGKQYYAESSGGDGFNGYLQNKHYTKNLSPISGVDYLESVLSSASKDQPIDILCIGPLTNLAILFNLQPLLIKKIRKLIIMGGEFTEAGNITQFAEFNVYCDPLAFRFVFDLAKQHDIDTVLIPANVCRSVVLTKSELKKLEESKVLPGIKTIVGPYLDYYLHNKKFGGFKGAILYDVLVAVYYKYPELFNVQPCSIKVNTTSSKRLGETTFQANPKSTTKLCMEVDTATIKHIFLSTLLTV